MEITRLLTDRRQVTCPSHLTDYLQEKTGHEAVEVSLCDEGMCFCSEVRHSVGTVLSVDFAPADPDNDRSLRSEAVVVDCHRGGSGYEITVIFTGN